jgi:dolichol-phosphate mannosyltransferase
MSGPRDLAIVIPAWNERENLELLLPALKEILADLGLRAQIIVADAGSADGTREVVAHWGAELVLQSEPGYGGALLAGFTAARAPYVVTMDADLSHRPVFLDAFWRHREDAQVLIASRYVAGGRADMGLFRRLLSVTLNRGYGLILDLPIRDLSSGFRMYRRDVLDGLDIRSRSFDILQELLTRVIAGGGRVREIPFHYMARGSGRSHVRLLRFGWAYLKTLVRMWRLRHSVGAR